MEPNQSDWPEDGWLSYSLLGQGADEPFDDEDEQFTNPERFRPLHQWALEIVARLQSEYEVALEECFGLDAELERSPLFRPTMRLTPLDESCAPVTIAFTDFPGLAVRVGRWATQRFPTCGCDECDEMPEEELESLTELMANVVAGRFRESMRLHPDGPGWSSWEFWSDDGRGSGGSLVSRERAARILDGKAEISVEWTPWQPSASASSASHRPKDD